MARITKREKSGDKRRDSLDVSDLLSKELKNEIENRAEFSYEKEINDDIHGYDQFNGFNLIFRCNSVWGPSNAACGGMLYSYIETSGFGMDYVYDANNSSTYIFFPKLSQEVGLSSHVFSFGRRPPRDHQNEKTSNDSDYIDYQKFVNTMIWAFIRRHDIIKKNSMKDISYGLEKL